MFIVDPKLHERRTTPPPANYTSIVELEKHISELLDRELLDIPVHVDLSDEYEPITWEDVI